MKTLTILVSFAWVSFSSAQATCNPKFWSPGHDYKNGQYSHGNASSAADWCVSFELWLIVKCLSLMKKHTAYYAFSCSKCAEYKDNTIGQCKFWTYDGAGTCWFKSNNGGYRKSCAKCTCGSVGNVPIPTPPTPPPTFPPLPKPVTPAPKKWDGKPVQVYIMMGQSNMLGEGAIIGPKTKNNTLESAVFVQDKFPWLKNGKTWSINPDMRNVFIMGSGNATFNHSVLQHNEWLTPDYGYGFMEGGRHSTIGPEFGIAHFGGSLKQDNVMLLKSCIGDRALGWDLLPPGTPRHDFTDSRGNTWTYAGYKDSPEKWIKNETKPPVMNWYAGEQWDGDTANAQYILDHFPDFFPREGGGATKYEIAGFFWWQGDKDSRDEGLSAAYEANLVNFIKVVRKTFNAPNAPFVTASLGQTPFNSTGNDGKILEAMLNVGCNGETEGVQTNCKYPEFKGNVAAVYTHPLLNTPGSSGAHYGGDAITYMNVGVAMGTEMAKLKAAAAQA